MWMRSPVKSTPRTGRASERPPMHLDDLTERLGSRIDAIRRDLDGADDLAVVVAHGEQDDRDAVLIATRAGVYVSPLWPADRSPRNTIGGWTGWTQVRVSPVRVDGRPSGGRQDPALATCSCTVVVGDARFIVSADGPSGLQAVDGFHDEVVRRGTPWHYPA